jgi:ribose transport system substrate-binding protein
MKRFGLASLVLLALFSATGCARGPKKASEITIAVIPQQLGNPVFLPAQKGMEDAGKELGIKVEWQAPVKAEAELQNDVVNGLIERKVDGIAISCTTPDALKDVLARAIKEGIKVSCYDADSPQSGRAFYAGTENYKAGFTCGEIMVKLFADSPKAEIKIAQLEGIPGAFDIEARKKGFADAIQGSKLKVVYSGPCDDDVDKAIEIVEAFTRSNPEIDGWFMSGGWPYVVESSAMPVTNEWKLKSKDHKIVTLDVFPTSYDFFDKGLLDVAVGQNFYQMGYLSVKNLYKLIKGEPIEGDDVAGLGKFINTGTQIVTVENYKTEIAK